MWICYNGSLSDHLLAFILLSSLSFLFHLNDPSLVFVRLFWRCCSAEVKSRFVHWAGAPVSVTTLWGWGWICCSDLTGWLKRRGFPTAAAAGSRSWTPPAGLHHTGTLNTQRKFVRLRKKSTELQYINNSGVKMYWCISYLVGSSVRSPCSSVHYVQRPVRPPGGAAWCHSPGRWSPRARPPLLWLMVAPSRWGEAAGVGRRPREERKLKEDEGLENVSHQNISTVTYVTWASSPIW